MITRNDLFKIFCGENKGLSPHILQGIFKSTTDEELAKSFNLTILRRGYFIN